MDLKQFLSNETGKPIVAQCRMLTKEEYIMDGDMYRRKLKQNLKLSALAGRKEIGEVQIETFEHEENIYLKGWAEVLKK